MLKKNLFGDTEAYLIFDDTVINKKYGYNVELTRRQYSGNEGYLTWITIGFLNKNS